jgi:hypothetical protein
LPFGAGDAGGFDLGELTLVSRFAFLVWLVALSGVFPGLRTTVAFARSGSTTRGFARARISVFGSRGCCCSSRWRR